MEIQTLSNRFQTAEVVLEGDEVHAWATALDPVSLQLESSESLLSADERLRADRFRFERDRARFVSRRSILRLLLSMYIGMPPESLQFGYNIYGKPMLSGGLRVNGTEENRPAIRFNVSHSEGHALYAFTRGKEIGVDIERIRPIPEMDPLAELFFSASENMAYRRYSGSLRRAAFFSCWTQKEAYVKAKGEGFSRSLDRFDVSLDPAGPAGLLSSDQGPGGTSRWTIRKVDSFAGFAAAIAVESPVSSLKCLHFSDHFPAFCDQSPL